MSTTSLDRWVIRLCAALAILHFIAAFTLTSWVQVVTTGWFDTRLDDPVRDSTLWFFFGGITLLALITLARTGIRANGAIPRQVGVYLLAVGIPLTVFQPVSGGVGVLIVGALALLAAHRAGKRAEVTAPGAPGR